MCFISLSLPQSPVWRILLLFSILQQRKHGSKTKRVSNSSRTAHYKAMEPGFTRRKLDPKAWTLNTMSSSLKSSLFLYCLWQRGGGSLNVFCYFKILMQKNSVSSLSSPRIFVFVFYYDPNFSLRDFYYSENLLTDLLGMGRKRVRSTACPVWR